LDDLVNSMKIKLIIRNTNNVNNTTHYLTHVSQDTPSYLLKLKTNELQQIYVETT